MKDLISIVVPVYNAEEFLDDTISSVLNQTYKNWELLLVNDCSPDNSKKVYEKFKDDKRIKWFDLKRNSGTAEARNKGIKESSGNYICFLDSDDFWDKDKLSKQVSFMKNNDCAFSFTGYEFAEEDGTLSGKKVHVPSKINYKGALKNTIIWTSTVMLDMKKLKKSDIYMPNVRRGQDTATWWKILKRIDYAYGLDEVLSYYRRNRNGLSFNKIVAFKRSWNLYRNVEKLGLVKSIYYFSIHFIYAIGKRLQLGRFLWKK